MSILLEVNAINFFDDLFKIFIDETFINHIDQKNSLPEFISLCDEIICPICLLIPLNPISCTICDNIFCKECFAKYGKCPYNCTNSKGKEIDKILYNMLNKLKFKCYNEECKEILFYKTYQNHLYDDCKFTKFICLTKDCGFIGNKKECIDHSFKCALKCQDCPYCKNQLYCFKYNVHVNRCGEEKSECDKCNELVKNKDMENHLNNLCDYSEVICSECNERMIRKEFKNHSKESCLQNQVNYWKRKSEEKDKKIKELEKENKKKSYLLNKNKKMYYGNYSNNIYNSYYEKNFYSNYSEHNYSPFVKRLMKREHSLNTFEDNSSNKSIYYEDYEEPKKKKSKKYKI